MISPAPVARVEALGTSPGYPPTECAEIPQGAPSGAAASSASVVGSGLTFSFASLGLHVEAALNENEGSKVSRY